MFQVLAVIIFIALINGAVHAHSGGLDSNGCHSGSRPYHCHNSSTKSSDDSIDAWDINIGYKYKFDKLTSIPYLGLSIGKQYGDDETVFGVDVGAQFRHGFYIGFASTSNSIQLGFNSVHLSLNSDSIGLGLRFPFDNANPTKSSVYFSGSGLVGSSSEM